MQAKAEPQPLFFALVTDVFAVTCSASASAFHVEMSSSCGAERDTTPMRKRRLGTAMENVLLTDRRFDGIAAARKKGRTTQGISWKKLRGKLCYFLPAM